MKNKEIESLADMLAAARHRRFAELMHRSAAPPPPRPPGETRVPQTRPKAKRHVFPQPRG